MNDDQPNLEITGTRVMTYEVHIYDQDLDREFTEEEKILLRPIAETIAMLDGNAFFTMPLSDEKEWYEQYLVEAYSVFNANGGMSGWASEVSWIKDKDLKNPAVKEAWDNFLMISNLAKESNKGIK